jgi:hypothetical protein
MVFNRFSGIESNRIMNWPIEQNKGIVRALAWCGVAAIFILSVIPANERPVTGTRLGFEHFTAFALVAGMFAIGYRFTLIRLLLIALLFCGGIELLQIPLPTRHARISDFAVDLFGSYVAIGLVALRYRLLTHTDAVRSGTRASHAPSHAIRDETA